VPHRALSIQVGELSTLEQPFRALAESIPHLVWTANPNGVADYHNQRWVEYSGLTPQDLMGGRWARAVHPDDIPASQKAWQTAIRDGSPYECEFRFKSKEGAYRWFLARAVPMRDSHGRIVKWFGTSTDIDDQKRVLQVQRFLSEATKAISSSLDYEATLKKIAKWAVPTLADWCAIDILGDNGELRRLAVEHPDPAKLQLAHDLAERYPPDKEAPRGVFEVLRSGKTEFMSDIPDALLVHAAKDEEHLRAIRQLGLKSYICAPLKARDRVLGALTLVHAESGRHYDEADVTFAEELAARASHAIENARVYSELTRAEAKLRKSEERYRSLVEATAEIVWTRNRSGEFDEPQPTWTAFTGQPFEALSGTGWLEKVHPDDREKVDREWRRVVTTKTSLYELEYRLQRHDGAYRTVLVRGVPVLDKQKQIREWVGISVDVTEQREAEAEVRRLNATLEKRVEERTAQLTEANQELESFSYSVSHDLRAPLRHITGFAQLLERRLGSQVDETARHYITTISASAQHGGRLVDDLLAFSRMGRAELAKQVVDLNAIFDDVRRELAADTEGRQIEWALSQLPSVIGDGAMLRIVVRNLLANAVKYTRGVEKARIEVGSDQTQDEIEIFVRDNGVGFDMRYVDKLFGVFQRLHTSEQFEGTGIGLANVRRIISRHGGRTRAEGAVGKGAMFAFTLPKQRNSR
jgi:PAS domain S-box-containing protein